MNSKI